MSKREKKIDAIEFDHDYLEYSYLRNVIEKNDFKEKLKKENSEETPVVKKEIPKKKHQLLKTNPLLHALNFMTKI